MADLKRSALVYQKSLKSFFGDSKGMVYPFSGFQRQSLWQGVGQSPTNEERPAKGEFQNSPVDCFERGNALQERAFPDEAILF